MLWVSKKNLDTPFSKFTSDTNPETLREFIRNSEREFGMEESDLSSMTDSQISKYIEFLDFYRRRYTQFD